MQLDAVFDFTDQLLDARPPLRQDDERSTFTPNSVVAHLHPAHETGYGGRLGIAVLHRHAEASNALLDG